MLALFMANLTRKQTKNDLAETSSRCYHSDSFTYRRLNIKMNTTTNFQLNPYAVQLCTLSRWISAKQWAPAGSGNFSIRSNAQDITSIKTVNFTNGKKIKTDGRNCC